MKAPSVEYYRKRLVGRGLSHAKSYSVESERFSHTGSDRKKFRMSKSPSSRTELPKSKWLKPREYLLLMIEAAVAVAAKVIQERLTAHYYGTADLTEHQASINLLYAKGYSALVSLLVGCLADSYVGYYTMAFFSVALHFIAICIRSMEVIIRSHPKGNKYAGLGWNISTVAIVLMKSTDFTRLVYGLEGLKKRKSSTIYLFLFLHFWVSSYATHGGIISTFISSYWNSLSVHNNAFSIPIASFVLTALSTFVFVYFLRPAANRKAQRGLGCRVVGCLVLTTYRKIFRRTNKRGRKGFFTNTEGTYDNITISKTKEILRLYALLVPALGITLSTMLDTALFYEQIIGRLKTDNTESAGRLGVYQLGRMILASVMLLSYFGLWPLLTLVGVENNATVKFLVGYLLIVVSMLYASVFFKTVEQLPYSTTSGLVRIFNIRKESVSLMPQDPYYSILDLQVASREGIMASYLCHEETLFPMTLIFNGTKTNFTTFLNVSPGKVTGYVIADPPQIIRIRGPYLPLREGPPRTNDRGARIFFYNTAETLKEARVWIKDDGGIMTTIALMPANYQFKLMHGGTKTVEIQEGGFYGAYISPMKEIIIDRVLDPSTAASWPFYSRYVIEGLAAGIGYPTLRGIIYNVAPQGLLAMSFAFLAFLEGIAFWIQLIGFKTWHYFVTGSVMFAYSVFVASFFVVCMFFSLKYIKIYI